MDSLPEVPLSYSNTCIVTTTCYMINICDMAEKLVQIQRFTIFRHIPQMVSVSAQGHGL